MVSGLTAPAPFRVLRRYVAVRHELTVRIPADRLPRAIESVLQVCGRLNCEVVSSNVNSAEEDSPPYGEVVLRLAPGDLKALFDNLGRVGRIRRHSTSADDKTDTVIETEAKLKNLTEFRDSLRTMLAKSAASVKDLVEIQRELSNVQSELDSLAAQRKVLANETDKVAVTIAFRSDLSGGALGSLGQRLDELRAVFVESFATLVTVVVAVIPWLILIVPGVWGALRFIRKLRRRRQPAA